MHFTLTKAQLSLDAEFSTVKVKYSPARSSLVAQTVKNRPAMQETHSIPGLRGSTGGGHGNPLQYSCLENPPGQRSLAGYSLWGPKESDMTEQLSTAQHSPAKTIKVQLIEKYFTLL